MGPILNLSLGIGPEAKAGLFFKTFLVSLQYTPAENPLLKSILMTLTRLIWPKLIEPSN